MRYFAIESLQRAKDLILKDDVESARYACLELRFCIEYITYDHLKTYIDDVNDDTIDIKWTPKQIIEDLLIINPDADQSFEIHIGIEDEVGVPATEMSFLGEDRRFSLRWANKNYRALGSFLHAPTLYQIKEGKNPTKEKVISKAKEVITELDKILASPVFNSKVQFYAGIFNCKFCNAEVKYGTKAIENGTVKCSKCKAIYDVALIMNNKPSIEAREEEYICNSCNTSFFIGSHNIYIDNIFSCPNCDAKAKVIYAIAQI